MEKKNIPELRFKGFEDEWELKTLGELAIFNPKSTLPRKFKYVDLESVLGTEMVGYTIHSKKSAPSRAQRLATYGDVFFQTVRPYQRNNLLFEIKENDYVFSTGYAQLRPIMSGSFLFALIQKDSFVQKVLDECTGTSFPAISSRSLSNISVNYSDNLFEQEKIGLLFKNIDKKLELEKEKHKKLKDFKNSMLKDMFPKEGESIPKLRFDGFDGQWSTYELSELGHKYTSLTGKTKKDFGHGSARYITFINVLENPISKIDGVEKIEIDNNQTSVKKGDIFFNISSETYDEVGLSSVWTYDMDNYYLNSFCTGFRPNVNLDSYFISYLLRSETLRKQITKLAQGISRINISQTKLLNIKLLIPEYQEQEKIGNFFKNLDQKIEASEEKIKKIEDFKKSLMEKMFV